MAHKIILDTDPGIDDAMAIFTAMAHPGIDLLGLTTTFGNVSVDQATRNALTLVEMADLDTPVARGVDKPSIQAPLPYPDFVHGKDGFADLNLPEPALEAHHLSAPEFIVEQVLAHPGEITLVAVGPLGNLAAALALEPAIAAQVKQVVLMGGTLQETGNVSPVAEANIFCDPHAADKVMAADWPLVMLGLDATHQVLLDRPLFADIATENPKVGQFMQKIAAYYIGFYEQERQAADGCYGHDVSAVAYVIAPDLFGTVSGGICVVPEGIAAGQTIMNTKPGRSYAVNHWDTRPNHQACMTVNAPGLVELFRNAMTSHYWRE